MAIGRPPLFDEVKQAKFCGMLAMGCSRQAAAKHIGVSPSTIRRHLDESREFVDQVRQAETDCEMNALGDVLAAAKKSWRAAAWVLQCVDSERWIPRRKPARGGKPMRGEPHGEDDLNTFELPTPEMFDQRELIQARVKAINEAARNAKPGEPFVLHIKHDYGPPDPEFEARANWKNRLWDPEPRPTPAAPVTQESPAVPDIREAPVVPDAPQPAATEAPAPDAEQVGEPLISPRACEPSQDSVTPTDAADENRTLEAAPENDPPADRRTDASPAGGVPDSPPVSPSQPPTYGARPLAKSLDLPRDLAIRTSANAP